MKLQNNGCYSIRFIKGLKVKMTIYKTIDGKAKIMELYEQYGKLIIIKIRGSKIIMEHTNKTHEASEEAFNVQTLKDKEDLVFVRKMVDILYTMVENFEE